MTSARAKNSATGTARNSASSRITAETPHSAEEAIIIQQQLREQVILTDDLALPPRLIAGVDVGYDLKTDTSRAIIALLDYKTMELLHWVREIAPTPFPYIPGLLSFREAPVILAALTQLPEQPYLLMIDGQGIAHPRRCGIACHVGMMSGLPAIGVAKKRLTGRHEEPGPARGSTADLLHKGEKIATVLRSREKCNPLFVSPGHRVSMKTALSITLHALRGYRLPEPTRIADKLSKQAQ